MEKQIKEWINAHQRDLAIVAITAIVVARLAPRRNVAYIQDSDGSYWVMPVKKA